jgi:hypothetical protein
MFEAALTSRNPHDEHIEPSQDYVDVFNSNALRISSMAQKVAQLYEEHGKEDSYFVICGRVNMLHGYGLPEKLWKLNPELKDITYTVSSN